MESLALSAVVIAALLVPGLVVYYTYVRNAASWTISASNDFVTPQAAIWAIVFSLLFHSLWGTALEFSRWPVDYAAVLSIVAERGDAIDFRIDEPGFLIQATIYLSSQTFAAWLLGLSIAYVLGERVFNLSKRIALSSNGAVWHELLRYPSDEKDFEGPVLTLTHAIDGQAFLYRGYLDEYQLDSTGKLVRVVLRGGVRRDFPKQALALEAVNAPEFWVPMSGERFVVNCERIDTIEVDYIWLQREGG